MGLGGEKQRRLRKTRRLPRGHGGKKTASVPVEACDSTKRSSYPSVFTSSDDERVKRARMTDSLRVESLIVSQSLQQRFESGASQSSSNSPSSSVVTAMEEEACGTAVVPPVCPVTSVATSDGGAMKKLTDRMKLKITGYIELLKKVDQPFSDPNDKSWITLFVSDMCGGGVELTTDDVLEWMEKLPDLFTPEAIDILRQHYNRLRALEEEKYAVHQNLLRVLSEMDGYEADDDSAGGDDDGNEKSSTDGRGFASDTN